MKKILILFGILDIITLIKSFNYWNRLIEGFQVNWLVSLSVFFYFSLAISAIWFFNNNAKGFIIYYFHFPIRIGLAIFSFGFIIPFSRLFEDYGFGIQVLSVICIVLETSRLISSILLHKKMKKMILIENPR